MKRLLGVSVCCLFLFVGCSHQRKTKKGSAEPLRAPRAASNLAIVTYEIVAKAEDDTPTRTAIYANGQSIGQTEPAPKSKKKIWDGRLPLGNHLIRCERWILVPSIPASALSYVLLSSGTVAPSPAIASSSTLQWAKDVRSQPWERFVRIEDGQRSKLEIKYFDDGREFSYDIQKEPMEDTKASTPGVNPASTPSQTVHSR